MRDEGWSRGGVPRGGKGASARPCPARGGGVRGGVKGGCAGGQGQRRPGWLPQEDGGGRGGHPARRDRPAAEGHLPAAAAAGGPGYIIPGVSSLCRCPRSDRRAERRCVTVLPRNSRRVLFPPGESPGSPSALGCVPRGHCRSAI